MDEGWISSEIKEGAYIAADQAIKGKYSDGKVNIVGTTIEVVIPYLPGSTTILTARDISHDLFYWRWTWSHAGETSMDLLSVIPVVRNLKSQKNIQEAEKEIEVFAMKLSKSVKLTKIKWSTVPKPDLSKIKNEKLTSIVNRNYRDGAKIGNGSTADAIRYEKVTGELLSPSGHIIKGSETINGLNNLLKDSHLSDYEKKITNDIINDLTQAINGK